MVILGEMQLYFYGTNPPINESQDRNKQSRRKKYRNIDQTRDGCCVAYPDVFLIHREAATGSWTQQTTEKTGRTLQKSSQVNESEVNEPKANGPEVNEHSAPSREPSRWPALASEYQTTQYSQVNR